MRLPAGSIFLLTLVYVYINKIFQNKINNFKNQPHRVVYSFGKGMLTPLTSTRYSGMHFIHNCTLLSFDVP